jgi:Tol biopolymer transport system component
MRPYATLASVTCLAFSVFAPPARGAQQTSRISVDFVGTQAVGGSSYSPMISADGSRVVFVSTASNLVLPNGSNGFSQVYVHDRLSGNVQRASGGGGTMADRSCWSPSISATGRYVVFISSALNLAQPVISWPAPLANVFLRDLSNGSTTVVSLGASGQAANGSSDSASVSSDGRYVAFTSQGTNLTTPAGSGHVEVYLRDMIAGTTTRVTVPPSSPSSFPNGSSTQVSISASGDWIAFASGASNLIAGDVNSVQDIFLYSRLSASLSGVTVNPLNLIGNGESHSPRVSDTGEFVAFYSSASNLTPGDTNANLDVFVWERADDTFTRASRSAAGASGNGASYGGSVSSDGVWVAFASSASNLVTGDTNGGGDVFRKNLATGAIERVSVSSAGQQASGSSATSSCSSDGRFVAFESSAASLVPGDTNGAGDVFLHGPQCSDLVIYCTAKTNSNGCVPTICSSGRASASGANQLRITAHRVLNLKSGLFFWGLAPQAAPFGGGVRCVAYPVVRTAIQQSGGNTTANDCTGAFQFDFTPSYIAAAGLSVGVHVYGQWWYRDPFLPLPNNVGLSDGLEFVIEP